MMTTPIFTDVETVGFQGPITLIQWAEGDGEIHLHCPWTEPVQDTIQLIERIATHPGGVVMFNAAFDWFHFCQMYTTLILLHDQDAILDDCIEEYAEFEPAARDGPCLKPVKCHDVMLHARKGPYQSMMDRGDIRIRRVPTELAWHLAGELERRIKLKDIYFARRKDKYAKRWQVYDIEDEVHFKDVVLKFAPSSALKALAADALDLPVDTVLLFADVNLSDKVQPIELGYAPFARAIGDHHNWQGAWPEVIKHHIAHWAYDTLARKYAAKDVEHTRTLYHHFGDQPLGDDDSELACMVAAVRWRGFRVDLAGIKELRAAAKAGLKRPDGTKIPTAPAQARAYVKACMDKAEAIGASEETVAGFDVSTKKTLLEEISTWEKECPDCRSAPEVIVYGEERSKCATCGNRGLVPHPSAERAKEVLAARRANYEVDFYDKLLLAGRFHASLSVIGALSSRMGGGGSAAGIEGGGSASGDGLNPQGVKKAKEVRRSFPLAWLGEVLCGGDFRRVRGHDRGGCLPRREFEEDPPHMRAVPRHDGVAPR